MKKIFDFLPRVTMKHFQFRVFICIIKINKTLFVSLVMTDKNIRLDIQDCFPEIVTFRRYFSTFLENSLDLVFRIIRKKPCDSSQIAQLEDSFDDIRPVLIGIDLAEIRVPKKMPNMRRNGFHFLNYITISRKPGAQHTNYRQCHLRFTRSNSRSLAPELCGIPFHYS